MHPEIKLIDILRIPLSNQHHPVLFYKMMKMGLNDAVLKNCKTVSKNEYEEWLSGHLELSLAYVDLFYIINEYRLGTDLLYGKVYNIIAALNKKEVILLIIL